MILFLKLSFQDLSVAVCKKTLFNVSLQLNEGDGERQTVDSGGRASCRVNGEREWQVML